MDSHLQQLSQRLTHMLHDVTPEHLQRGPEGKWCVAEILEHLYLTYTGTIRGFERIEQSGKPLATGATVNQRLMAFVVIAFGYFPTGRKAPARTEPRGLARQQLASEIVAKVGEMDAAIARSEQRFGASTKLLNHPILGPLTAQQWRKFHFVHGIHHLKQIQRLLG